MLNRAVAIAGCLLLTLPAFAKDKKPTLPAYVLTARTITVIIDPSAGISLTDPRANQIAAADVEAALRTWGRFEIVENNMRPDLVIVVRRGHGRESDATVHDPRQNGPQNGHQNYPGGQTGGMGPENSRPPNMPGSTNPIGPGVIDDRPYPQMEIGAVNDVFSVYRGDVDHPLETSPAWKYTSSDALQPHSVPAVDKFHKAITDAEKATQKGP